MKQIGFATLVALLSFLVITGSPRWITVPLAVFLVVLGLLAYFDRRFKYSWLWTLRFLSVACILSACVGWGFKFGYASSFGLKGTAEYGTTPAQSFVLLLAGVVLANLGTSVWRTIYLSERDELAGNHNWLERQSPSLSGKVQGSSYWEWFTSWLKSRKLRLRIQRVAATWAPLSSRPQTYIDRPELTRARQLLSQPDSPVVCVLGEKGSGKTTLFLELVDSCTRDGLLILPVKADLLPAATSFESWLSELLQISEQPQTAIRRLAARRKLIILFDQLDALADLVDLTSNRLNQIMAFIAEVAKFKNVSIVCSCRTSDFRRDIRFAQLKCTTLDLEPPSWEAVTTVLTEAGIADPQQFPQAMHEVLRNPQHLQVYLRQLHRGQGRGIYLSYYDLLDELWAAEVNTEERRGLVYRLTSICIDHESLSVPSVQLEGSDRVVAELVSAGILSRDQKITSFRHQTLLEYAKARLFAKSDQSLCAHVLERQNAVRVRPTLWAVITYLREVDPVKYAKEIDDFFASDLRLHIRYLLIDFLGQVKQPTDSEIVHLASRLSDSEDRKRVLIAIQGSEEWFETLCNTHFAAQMSVPVEEAWPMVAVLSRGWAFAREKCLQLIKKNWLPLREKDQLTYRAMQQLASWDEEAVEVVCTLIRRADNKDNRLWWAEGIVSTISHDKPDLAPRVFLATVEHEWKAEQTGISYGPLKNSRGWYELPEVARAAPLTFLRDVWPWFVQHANTYSSRPGSFVLNHYGGSLKLTSDDIDEPSGEHIIKAITVALKLAAELNPSEFVDIVRPTWTSESLPVHRLICRTLAAATGQHAAVALEYLSEDTRRFFLGDYVNGYQADSCELVGSLSEQLDQKRLEELVSLIRNATQYRPEVDQCDEQRKWDREARLLLLKSLPMDRLSPVTVQHIRSEEDAFPDYARKRYRGHSGFVREVPKIPKEKLQLASDEEVLEALQGPLHVERDYEQELRVEGGFERPGGVYAQTQELCELAKEDRGRVVALLPDILANGNEYTVAAILQTLGSSEMPSPDAYALVSQLAGAGAESEEFRAAAGYLLYRCCLPKAGLPAELLLLLERWLGMPWPSAVPVRRERDDEKSDEGDSPTTVLWSPGGGAVFTDQAYWPLVALTNGYLMQEPADTGKWLDVLERAMDWDICDETWTHYCRELRWIRLKGCDRTRGEAVIKSLFGSKPAVATSGDATQLVAMIADILSEQFVLDFTQRLRTSGKPRLQQAYGELLTLIALRQRPHAWACGELENRLAEIQTSPSEHEFIAVGIAFAAAHLWDEVEARTAAGELLCRLMPHATTRVNSALGAVCWARDDFPADEVTRELLTTIEANATFLNGSHVDELIGHLASLVPHLRQEVLSVCQKITGTRSHELLSIAYSLYGCGPKLVNIAMTLQRFDDTRSQALDFLEQLLRVGLSDAYAVLNETDLRPGMQPQQDPPRRRRRRRG